MKITKIYTLMVTTTDGRNFELGWSDSLKVVRKEVNSEMTANQLKELGIKKGEVELFEIRDNYFPINFYPVQ